MATRDTHVAVMTKRRRYTEQKKGEVDCMRMILGEFRVDMRKGWEIGDDQTGAVVKRMMETGKL